MEDRVNHPAHYALPGLGAESIDVVKAVVLLCILENARDGEGSLSHDLLLPNR